MPERSILRDLFPEVWDRFSGNLVPHGIPPDAGFSGLRKAEFLRAPGSRDPAAERLQSGLQPVLDLIMASGALAPKRIPPDAGYSGLEKAEGLRMPGRETIPQEGLLALSPEPLASKAGKAIRAFHGSPHDFDKFSTEKIGAGEGAQAYGRGLYFAEAEETAKSYRGQLPGIFRYDGEDIPYVEAGKPGSARRVAVELLWSWQGDKKGALDDIVGYPKYLQPKIRKELRDLDFSKIDRGGRLYEVGIKASPDEFLDWDKPLSQQSEKIQGILDENGIFPGLREYVSATKELEEISALPSSSPLRGEKLNERWDKLQARRTELTAKAISKQTPRDGDPIGNGVLMLASRASATLTREAGPLGRAPGIMSYLTTPPLKS